MQIAALEKLSPRERGVLAGGAGAAAAILLYFFAVEPAWLGYAKMQGEIEQLAGMVARYRAYVANTPGALNEKAGYEADLKKVEEAVLINDTDALAAAQLTEVLRAKAQAAGIALATTKPEKGEPLGDRFRLINVGVTFNAPLTLLARFMQEMENDPKLMRVREAHILSQKQDWPDDQPETLSVRLLITALRGLPHGAPTEAK